MKRIRKISPVISILLVVITLTASSGIALIKHSCHHCGITAILTSVDLMSDHHGCCCCEDHCDAAPVCQNEKVMDYDCCSDEAETIVTSDLVRGEVQPEIVPYLIAALLINIIYSGDDIVNPVVSVNNNPVRSSDITTLHCQIIS